MLLLDVSSTYIFNGVNRGIYVHPIQQISANQTRSSVKWISKSETRLTFFDRSSTQALPEQAHIIYSDKKKELANTETTKLPSFMGESIKCAHLWHIFFLTQSF